MVHLVLQHAANIVVIAPPRRPTQRALRRLLRRRAHSEGVIIALIFLQPLLKLAPRARAHAGARLVAPAREQQRGGRVPAGGVLEGRAMREDGSTDAAASRARACARAPPRAPPGAEPRAPAAAMARALPADMLAALEDDDAELRRLEERLRVLRQRVRAAPSSAPDAAGAELTSSTPVASSALARALPVLPQPCARRAQDARTTSENLSVPRSALDLLKYASAAAAHAGRRQDR